MGRAVTVVSKRGCHMCEKVVEALDSLSSRYGLDIKVVDINDDPKLHDKYWLTIPVVQIDGKDVFDANDIVNTVDYVKTMERLVSNPRVRPRVLQSGNFVAYLVLAALPS